MLECETHRALNRLVGEHAVNSAVEGNYSHFHMARLSAHTPSDPRRSWKRQYLRFALRGRGKALEIGFNAGHSAAIMLAAEPGLIVFSIDIGVHPYTLPCAKYMEAAFPERFTYVEGDSKVVLDAIDLSYFDFVHIDGGHELSTVENDLSFFCQRANSGTFLMVDDAYSPAIANAINARIKRNLIVPAQCGLPSSGENWLFYKV